MSCIPGHAGGQGYEHQFSRLPLLAHFAAASLLLIFLHISSFEKGGTAKTSIFAVWEHS